MQTGLHLHVILLLWTLSLSSCSVSCLAQHVGFLHLSTCESRGRRSWVAGGATKGIRSMVLSSSADDEVNSSDADIDNDGGPMPLFPELANPSPLPPPQSYDDAVDALQNRRRGSPSSSAGGQSSERALSTSEEIRNALDGDGGGGLAAAAMAIRKAMSPGGEWYDPDADDNGDEDADDEEECTSNLDLLLGEDADTNMDRAVPDENDEMDSSPLTNLDYLLGKLGERSTRNDES
mmetsp:Transcript_29807/g.69952  ORF Transcript_29807/g.69952 Transcript_29807/m.69952 type:complete len:235 (-) Transcript_29807:83-787(-)